jgi:hypothetical protein
VAGEECRHLANAAMVIPVIIMGASCRPQEEMHLKRP